MIENIVVSKTNDGKLFDNKNDAIKHIITKLENGFGVKLDAIVKNKNIMLSGSERIMIVDGLIGNIDKAKELQKLLNFWLD